MTAPGVAIGVGQQIKSCLSLDLVQYSTSWLRRGRGGSPTLGLSFLAPASDSNLRYQLARATLYLRLPSVSPGEFLGASSQ